MKEVNSLDYNAFTDYFGSLYEHTPLVAAAAWSKRPFSDVSDIHKACCFVVDQLGQDAQAGLLRCHPDLAGRLAMQGQLSQASTKEQSSAGLLSLTEEEFRRMDEQNRLYKEKFGFPFVICVRENKKEAILRGFGQRLPHSVDEEVEIATGEVNKIAWHRLQDLVESPMSPRL